MIQEFKDVIDDVVAIRYIAAFRIQNTVKRISGYVLFLLF